MKKLFAPISSLLIFYLAIAYLYIITVSRTGGSLIYTLDDPYIHLAIAKNFAQRGIWGITQYEFTSCSSSTLWTFLISCLYFVFGVKTLIPFMLNIIFASLTAITVFAFVKEFTENIIIQTSVLIIILFLTPFVSVVFTGLEHSMYSFFIVLTVFYLCKVLKDGSSKKDEIIFLISLALLSSTRYEAMLAAAAMFLVFLFVKKFYTGLLSLVFCFIPVFVVGLISLSKGWYFFPNSVLLKSGISFADFNSFIKSIINPQFVDLIIAYKKILVLVLISVIMFFALKKDNDSSAIKPLIFVFILTTVLHINFAKLGSLQRYEMYLMVFGMLLNSVLILKFLNGKGNITKYITGGLVLVLIVLFSLSSIKSMKDVTTASENVYRMQYQTARFIKKYYEKGYVALNDIGAVNYYCDIHCLDLWGLANREVAESKRTGRYSTEKINEISKENKTEIAIVFDSWFEKYGGLPKGWYNSGSWKIPDNITCGSDNITFYATDSLNRLLLSKNLLEFQKELPGEVEQRGEFLGSFISF